MGHILDNLRQSRTLAASRDALLPTMPDASLVGRYQIYDRLRKVLEGSLLEKDAKKFIENDGSKRYRISTHPDFVTCERGESF